MCASKEIVEKINLIAQAAVLQTSTVTMMVVSKFIDMFDLDAHVETVRAVYEHRCNVMMDAMAKYFPKGSQVHRSRRRPVHLGGAA